MNEMIERVARAIADILSDEPTADRLAQVAIEAMREPTYPMIDAGGEALYELTGNRTPDVEAWAQAAWPAMIDAALAEK